MDMSGQSDPLLPATAALPLRYTSNHAGSALHLVNNVGTMGASTSGAAGQAHSTKVSGERVCTPSFIDSTIQSCDFGVPRSLRPQPTVPALFPATASTALQSALRKYYVAPSNHLWPGGCNGLITTVVILRVQRSGTV